MFALQTFTHVVEMLIPDVPDAVSIQRERQVCVTSQDFKKLSIRTVGFRRIPTDLTADRIADDSAESVDDLSWFNGSNQRNPTKFRDFDDATHRSSL